MKILNINEQYEKLAFEQEIRESGNILSGWQCENPFVDELQKAVKNRSSKMDYKRYMYFDEDEKLLNKIKTLHKNLDGVRPSCVICGSGSTSLIFAFITHLKNLDVKKVFYISPIYFTMLPALQRYGIQSERVSQYHPYEK